ncbi:MAG: ThuA domain-containing protein [Aurantibacter sp.]
MSNGIKNVLMGYVMVTAIFWSYQVAEAQEISSFTLINAQEDIEIGLLSDGDSIYIPDLNTEELNVRANVAGQIGSILFELDGEIVRAENTAPYALFGISGNDYNSWIPELRIYTITGLVYSLPQGQGTLLNTHSISVIFTDQVAVEPTGPVVQSLVLINADSDEDIAEIIEGSVFVLEEIGTTNLNIRAETGPDTESVVFGYQGEPNYHTESLPEYAIGANDDADYRPWIPDLGANTVTATAFTKDRGTGTSGNPLTVNFEIIEETPDKAPPFVLRINSGGAAVVFNDSINYIADTLFIGNGQSYTNNNIADILETTQDSIYKTERTTNANLQSFGYNIPVSDGDYEIKLHFAEIYWGATGGDGGGEGKRVFGVAIEGEEVITDYDMNAEKDPMTAIIKTFSATVVDGELNIDFGASVNQPKVAALEIYGVGDVIVPLDCVWDELASSSQSRMNAESVKVDDKLYLMGSFLSDSTLTTATKIYDLETDTWSAATPMPTAVSLMGAVGLGEEIWLIGGLKTDSLNVITDKVQIYNTTTDTWSAGPPLPNPRSAGVSTYNNGKIHFFGGLMSDGATKTSDHYVLDLNDSLVSWQVAKSLPDPRSHLGAATVNGKIYAIGGQQTLDSIAQAQVYLDEYDPLTDSWSKKADLPSARSNFENATAIYGNKIIIVGGKRGDSFLNTVTEYDIETDSWSERCQLPFEIGNPSAAVFGDRMIVANGDGKETISISLEPEIEIPEESEISVLVYHETNGFRHGSIESGIDMIIEFGNDLGWAVKDSQTSDVFENDSLVTYDVVIWLNTTGDDLLTESEQSAFEDFVQNGGGFVGVHSATDTYRDGSWPWYNDLVGAIVQILPYHTANNTNATIDVVGQHPAIEHLGNEWNKNEEYYYWERNGGYLFNGNIDLLRVRATGPNSYDASRPVTWYKEYDGGRSFYTALGHNDSDYESNDNFRTMLREAIIWAAEKGEPIADNPTSDLNNAPTENNTIELFPNPVTDQLTIGTEILSEVDSGEVSIFGLDGNLIKQKTIDRNDNQIDLSDLLAGYYIASLRIESIAERHLIYKE